MGSLQRRAAFLDRVDLIRRLRAAGLERHASLLSFHDAGRDPENLILPRKPSDFPRHAAAIAAKPPPKPPKRRMTKKGPPK
jgi:hypothetical protein